MIVNVTTRVPLTTPASVRSPRRVSSTSSPAPSETTPRISPGKTWSGALGGLTAAVIAAALVAGVADPPRAPGHLLLVAVLLGIIAQVGDLLESLIKRHFGVKDSGHIIPGHGGLLDRLDALLAAAPVAALLALLAGPGVVVWQ